MFKKRINTKREQELKIINTELANREMIPPRRKKTIFIQAPDTALDEEIKEEQKRLSEALNANVVILKPGYEFITTDYIFGSVGC